MASNPEPLLVILAPPPPFLLVTGRPSMPWPKWLKSFKKYIQALDEDELSDSSKCALLQNCLGTEGQRVSMALIPKESTFSAVISALTTYFSSKHSLQSCCLHFRHMAQKPRETASQFVAALKKQLNLCNNEHLKSLLILDQLIEKANCPQLRQRLRLERETLTLEQALVISKEFEYASNESRLLDVHEISKNLPDDSDPSVQKKAKRARPRRGEERVENQTNQQTSIPFRPQKFRDDYYYAHDKQYFTDEDSQPKTINTKLSPNFDPTNKAVIDSGTMTEPSLNTEPKNSWMAAIDSDELDECHDDDDDEEDKGLEPSPTALQEGFCEICGRDFRKAYWLARHMRTHTEEKPFSCPKYNLTFSQSYHLTRHMRNQHGADCYVCPVCGESFGSKSELLCHKKSHTSQVPSHPLHHAESQKRNKLKSHMVHLGIDNVVLADGLTSVQSSEVDHQEISNSYARDCENDGRNISDMESHANLAVSECPDRGCETNVQTDSDTSQDGGASKTMAPAQGKINHFCPICVRRHFRSASKLARHMTTHIKEGAFSCPVCALTFTRSYIMKQHVREKHNQGKYNCPKCPKSFSSWPQMRAHRKTHSVTSLKCPDCGKRFGQMHHLKRHIASHYKETSEVGNSNPNCQKKFALAEHEKGHQNKQSYHCPVCHKYFLKLHNYRSHIKIHITQESICQHCKAIFPTAIALKYHLRTHVEEPKLSTNCDPASEAVIDSETMTEPPLKTKPENNWMAAIDDAELDECHDVNNEEDEGLEPSPTALQEGFCEICGKDFRKPYWLARHMRTHTKEKPFSCPQCNLTFSQSYHMTRHIRNQHGADCYVCPVCGDSFGSNSELHHHKKSHTLQVLSHPYRDAKSLKRNKLKSRMVPPGRDKIVLAEGLTSVQSSEVDHQEISNSYAKDCENEGRNISDLDSHANSANSECPNRGCETSVQTDGDTSQDGGASKTKESSQGKINHSCSICVWKHFRSASKLARHMTTHTKERAFRCPICALTFTQSYKLKQHVREKHRQGQYNCPKCPKSFSSWPEVQAHRKTHFVKCQDCGKKFGRMYHLKRHILCHYKESSEVGNTCPNCQKKFAFAEDLSKHLESHTKEDNGICPKCDATFCSLEDLETHMKVHKKSYSCKTCGKNFKVEYAYSKHVKGHQNKQCYHCSVCHKYFLKLSNYMSHIKIHSTRESKCPHCKAIFPTTIALKYHLRTHMEERPHQCNCCIETFEDKNELERHCLKHRKFRKERPYACIRCDYAFSTLGELREHMSSHKGEEPLSCSVCGKTFLNKNKLERHQLLHSGKRSHLCTVCGSSFPSAGSLRLHSTIHTGEKPHKCLQCDKTFRTAGGLRLHSRQHMEVRPSYKCHDCGRTYGRMTELKIHQRYHTGDRPYVCTCCNKRFVRKDKLKVHMRVHTGERPYKCMHCEKTFTQSGDKNRHIAKFHSDAVETQGQ